MPDDRFRARPCLCGPPRDAAHPRNRAGDAEHPTGAIYPPETIAAFADLAAARGLCLSSTIPIATSLPSAGQRPTSFSRQRRRAAACHPSALQLLQGLCAAGLSAWRRERPTGLHGAVRQVCWTPCRSARRASARSPSDARSRHYAGWRREKPRDDRPERAGGPPRNGRGAGLAHRLRGGAYFRLRRARRLRLAQPKLSPASLRLSSGCSRYPGATSARQQECWLRIAFANVPENKARRTGPRPAQA